MPAKKSNNGSPKVILLAVILSIVAIALYYLLQGGRIQQSKEPALLEPTKMSEPQMHPGSATSSLPPETLPAEEKPIPLATKDQSPNTESPNTQCLSLAAEMEDFFSYLDSQPYIANYELQGGIQAHVKRILHLLFTNPPSIPEKRGNLFDAMKNTAHFYRVLGAKNLMLGKDYLDREEGRLEYDFNLFFQWALHDSCPQQTGTDVSLPLPALYQYASFFLLTPGGKSYLFRRSPQISLLVQYFSIRIVDLANDRKSNIYAIDLLPPITTVLFQLQSEQILEDQAEYIEALKQLRLKYLNQLKGKTS